MSGLPALATRDRVMDAVLVVACGLGQAGAAAIAAFAMRDAFAALHAGSAVPVRAMIELGGAGLGAAACLYLAHRRSEALGQSFANSLRRRLYRHIASLPKSRHDTRRVGALSLRFVGDLSAARLWFGNGLPDVLTAMVVLPSAVAILFALDPRLAPAALGSLLAAAGIATALAWHLQARHRALRSRRARLAIAMIERIAMSPDLDAIGRTGRELRGLDARGAALRADAVARRSRMAALQAVLQAGTAVAGLAILWQAGRTDAEPGAVAASLAILALVALPLQALASAWDRFCAWRVARAKALSLFAEPALDRGQPFTRGAVSIEVRVATEGHPKVWTFQKGEASRLDPDTGRQIARVLAGLDSHAGMSVTFDGTAQRPRTCFLADDHVGLEGSLRRSATLLNRKRPSDRKVRQTLEVYGLGRLLETEQDLDFRVAENGRNLTVDETVRLDFARAELGKVGLLVIDSVRWRASAEGPDLMKLFRSRCEATVLVVDQARAQVPDAEGSGPEPETSRSLSQRPTSRRARGLIDAVSSRQGGEPGRAL